MVLKLFHKRAKPDELAAQEAGIPVTFENSDLATYPKYKKLPYSPEQLEKIAQAVTKEYSKYGFIVYFDENGRIDAMKEPPEEGESQKAYENRLDEANYDAIKENPWLAGSRLRKNMSIKDGIMELFDYLKSDFIKEKRPGESGLTSLGQNEDWLGYSQSFEKFATTETKPETIVPREIEFEGYSQEFKKFKLEGVNG